MSNRWALFWSIAICLCVYLTFCTGCATTQKTVIYLTHDCQGREVDIRVREITSPTSGLDCIRNAGRYGQSPVLAAAQLPISCAWRDRDGAVVILPSWLPVEGIAEHEYEHLVPGHGHPAFVPWMTEECS